MKTKRKWMSGISFLLAFAFLFAFHGDVFAGSAYLTLNGSGPVYSKAFSPGDRQIQLTIWNHNNLNVGFDVIDQGNGHVIANGTVKDRGTYRFYGTAHRGRTYKLRLRCQEPPWNKTKCNASAQVVW